MADPSATSLHLQADHLTNFDGSRGSPVLGRPINKLQSDEEDGTPLETPWTFWIDKSIFGGSAADYEAQMKEVYTISTVEGFWSIYNNIPRPSRINNRYSYHLMRNKRKPMWEDPSHCKGGNWKLKCAKDSSDEVWKEILLAAIGEQLRSCVAEDDEISGVSVSVRERDDVLQIWNTQSSLADQASIIQKVQELLPQVKFLTTFYKPFESHEAFERRK